MRLPVLSEVKQIVYRMSEILLAAEIAFRRLHGCMPQQELNLLQLATARVAKLGTGSPQVMRCNMLQARSLATTLDYVPHDILRDAFPPHLSRSGNPPKDPSLRDPGCHYPLIKCRLDPLWNRQLRILAIRLLLPHSLRSHLGSVADPQLEVQLRQRPFKPARMPTGFHPYTYLHSLDREIAVELLRLLAMLQSTLPAFACFGLHKSNLSEARMVVTTLYLVCICPIRSLCVNGGLDRDSAGGRSHP